MAAPSEIDRPIVASVLVACALSATADESENDKKMM
jgi:hypothetical protein